MSLRAQLATLRPKVRRVDVPELPGVEVFVRALNGKERAQIVARMRTAAPDNPVSDAEVVLLGLCDANGTRVYADTELAEVEQLDGGVLFRLSGEILGLAGLRAGATEEAAKN